MPLNDATNNHSVTKAANKIQNNGKGYAQNFEFESNKLNDCFSIRPNSVDIEMGANPSEPTYADRTTKSFGTDNDVFTESICKKVGSENISLEQLQSTLRNIQVLTEYGRVPSLSREKAVKDVNSRDGFYFLVGVILNFDWSIFS